MNKFQAALKEVVAGREYEGSQKRLAALTGLDEGQISRVLRGQRTATPVFVGHICGILGADDAAKLLGAFLQDVADETLATPVPDRLPTQWSKPFSKISVALDCIPAKRPTSKSTGKAAEKFA